MKEHVILLGALYIAFSAQLILAAIVVLIAVAGGGILSGDPEAMAITGSVAGVISSLLIVLAIPGLICGIALLKRRPWSRYLAIVLGCFNLLAAPFGTLLGIYTIWVLIKPEAAHFFDRSSPTTD
ncbi:MAG: hypothetical protein JSW50_12440 [Candidatus Latescibacterota bacterium]|nr:MAG: hypothetical protein JSW50_12440 [Candidatus Latescibacterota bacterium]